jgi:molybdopterin converting factor small subunit
LYLLTIRLFCDIIDQAGWTDREIELDSDSVTLNQVLAAARVHSGENVLDLITVQHHLKESYVILVNSHLLASPVDFNTELNDGDRVDIMQYPFLLDGG